MGDTKTIGPFALKGHGSIAHSALLSCYIKAILLIAVVMKCDDVSRLEQYLCSLSVQLNVECFEFAPVEFEPGIFIFKGEHSTDQDLVAFQVLPADFTQKISAIFQTC